MPIDLDNIRTEQWMYTSEYPLQIMSMDEENNFRFNINLYQWRGKIQSLKLIPLQFKSAPNAEIVYIDNPKLDKSTNQIGESLVNSEKFIVDVKPLIISGFRDVSIKNLLDLN